MSYVGSASDNINSRLKQTQIDEFNAQITVYASKQEGYLGLQNTISVQEFVTLCNFIRNWNENNPSDRVTINMEHNRIMELCDTIF